MPSDVSDLEFTVSDESNGRMLEVIEQDGSYRVYVRHADHQLIVQEIQEAMAQRINALIAESKALKAQP